MSLAKLRSSSSAAGSARFRRIAIAEVALGWSGRSGSGSTEDQHMVPRIGNAGLIWLVAALAVAGCGGGSQATGENAPGESAVPRTVVLAAMSNSGITGTATLQEKGDSTTVVVTLAGGSPSTSYPNHIHQGTCDQSGPVVVSLASVTIGQQGSGSGTTTVATKALQDAKSQAGSILVMAHLPNGTPAACGVI
ncbi:MAG: CHRD domain-containing protein [Gemmatimonadetes bacterium]|nr:CHRD domain-containing protein [Gemmatimonadota bacterium]MBI2535867.1 CHRD domain-containing protein [Gemmatimonadota bacterium]